MAVRVGGMIPGGALPGDRLASPHSGPPRHPRHRVLTNKVSALLFPRGRRRKPLLVRPAALAIVVLVASMVPHPVRWTAEALAGGGLEGWIRVSDFVSTLTGALIVHEGNGPLLYDQASQRAAQERVLAPYFTLNDDGLLPFNHLPSEAVLVAPLMDLPYALSFALWTVLALLAMGLSVWLLQRARPLPTPALWAMILAVAAFHPLHRALWLGQNSPLVLLGMCGAYAYLERGRHGRAGVWLALAALKPQILPVVVLLLILQRRWRALVTFATVLAGASVAVMPLVGVGWPFEYARLLLQVSGWDNARITPAIMPNWRGFAINLFGGSAPALVAPVFVGLSALSIGLVVWAWWRVRDRRAQTTPSSQAAERRDLLWSLAGIVAVLDATHLNPHDLTLLLFPAWLVAAHVLSGRWERATSRLWLWLLWTIFALAPLTLIPRVGVIAVPLLLAVAIGLLVRRIAAPAAAGHDRIVEMDADGSRRPDDLPRLLAASADADVVIGSRNVPGGVWRAGPRCGR